MDSESARFMRGKGYGGGYELTGSRVTEEGSATVVQRRGAFVDPSSDRLPTVIRGDQRSVRTPEKYTKKGSLVGRSRNLDGSTDGSGGGHVSKPSCASAMVPSSLGDPGPLTQCRDTGPDHQPSQGEEACWGPKKSRSRSFRSPSGGWWSRSPRRLGRS
jgi:hypothetical protein